MNLKKIKIRNFFSFGDTDQEIDLSSPGLFLVTGHNEITNGSNGAGKSTLVDGICFALYGKVTKDVKLEKIVNEIIGKDCSVELDFESAGSMYFIKRYKSHSKFKDKLFVYKDIVDEDHLVSKNDKTDSQEELNKIIKINYKSFVNAVMLSQETLISFVQTDSAKKKEIIENILQLETITKYHAIATQKRKIRKSNVDSLSLEIQNLTNISLNTKETIDSYLKSCKKQEEENELNILRYQGELAVIEAINIEKEMEKIEKVNELLRKKDNIQTKIDHKTETFNSLVENQTELHSQVKEYNVKLLKSKENKILITKEIENLENKIAQFKEIEKIREEAKELQRQFDSKKKDYDYKVEIIKGLKSKQESCQHSISEFRKIISDILSSNKQNKNEMRALTEQIKKLSEKIKETKENPSLCPLCKNVINKEELDNWIQEKEEELKEKEDLLKQKNEADKSYLGRITEADKNIKDLEAQDKEIEENISVEKEIARDLYKKYSSIEIPTFDDAENIDYDKEISAKNKNIASCETEIKEFTTSIERLMEQKRGIEEKIDEITMEVASLRTEYDSIEIFDTKSGEELKELQDKKIQVITKIEELRKKKFVDEGYLEGLKQQIRDYIEELKERKKENKKAKKDLIVTQWWEDGLSSKKNSMKSWCISNINGYFNARIKFYMDKFFDGEVSLQLDNDLNETINFISKERAYGQFSGGEKRRLNLAILFALNDIVKTNMASRLNIMFLDEVLSNYLDDKGISVVLDILSEMKQKKHSVWVIDHRDNFKDYPDFENVKITKNKSGFSHISFGKSKINV
jgi:DNA repair exonuclease SbcCD ATPase subunit